MLGSTSVLDRWAWRLGMLDPASPQRINLSVLFTIAGVHLLALLACVPWLFSWSGLAWGAAGLYVFGVLGVNIGYHRLLTHRGFACPRWLEHVLVILGACSRQGTPMSWAAVHRMHHQHSDEPGDPHCPRASFAWSHVGWTMIYDPALYNLGTYDRYARDLFQDRFYKWLERPGNYGRIQHCQEAFFLLVGMAVGLWTTSSLLGALQLGLSWLVWGVFVRTVLVWHVTWSVNSATHLWGYRSFDTPDDSRNNWLVGVVSAGEGWHNNHHADPRCAAHGLRWWEIDGSYLTIRLLQKIGLAWGVVKSRRHGRSAPTPNLAPNQDQAAA